MSARSANASRAALLLSLFAAAAGLWWMFDAVPDASDRLRDDAFYEFAWASNVAAGRGPVVSDGVTTSGVQLLWSLLLVPVAWAFGAGSLPLIAPWLGFALHVVAAGVLVRSVRDRTAGLCAGLCWLGHPLLLRESQNGQETALAALLLLLLWRARRGNDRVFGLLALLVSLARSDLWPAVALLAVARTGTLRWRGVWIPSAILALLFAADASLGGGVWPDSAAPMAWLWHRNFEALQPDGAEVLGRWWWYVRPVLFGGPWCLLSAFGTGLLLFGSLRPLLASRWRIVPPFVVVGCALLGIGDLLALAWASALLASFPSRSRTRRRLPLDLLALAAGALALMLVHWAIRWYPRDYYLAPLVVLPFAVLLRVGRWRTALLLFAIAQVADLPRVRPEPLGGQVAMELAGETLASVLPPGERVGCFNSGLVTFGADVLRAGRPERRAVVNLDGVVDHRAFAALKKERLADWLDAERIHYVLDNPVEFSTDVLRPHANGRWFAPGFAPERDLREVARFVVPGIVGDRPGTDEFLLYRRVGRASPPPRPERMRDLGPFRAGRAVLWPAGSGQAIELLDGDRRLLLAEVSCDTVVIVAVPSTTGEIRLRGGAEVLLRLGGD